MSKHFIQIPGLLKPEETLRIESLLPSIEFVDGKATAGMAAREVKNNLQAAENNKALYQVQEIIDTALATSPLFNIAALPKKIYPPIVSKYSTGKYYGWHVDSPVMGDPAIRTDLAMTIFLSDPSTYEGGELILQTASGNVMFKPAKGDAVLYPCQYLHCVNEVRSGERTAVVTWVQSNIASPEQRQILFDLNQVHAVLHQKDMHSPECNLLLQTHSNLFRMWADV
ncbi:MAG: Fe2+-dependent dioxygenase [Chitinophagaceae bacterium]|nr:Fe2+-dependent dioxygenase [Chitinophagaceae bacterium]